VSRDEFVTLQRNDASLISLFDLTESEPFPDNRSYLFVKNGLLMRREIPKSNHNIAHWSSVQSKARSLFDAVRNPTQSKRRPKIFTSKLRKKNTTKIGSTS